MTKYRRKIREKYTIGTPGNVVDAGYFYYDTAPREFKDLAIVCGGYERCAGDFDINRSNYPYYFVKYTLKGKGTLKINDQILSLKPGILTGFEPGTPHRYKTDTFDPMEHIFFTFVGNKANELLKKSGLNKNHYIETADSEGTLKMCQKILDTGLQKKMFSQEICCSYLRILLLEQGASLSNCTKAVSISKSTYQKCKQYIDANFSVIKSPNQVADKCDIDVRYMASLFKKYDHLPPSRYIMCLKMNKATNLLLATDLKIKEIARHVGFDDPYHFSKNFKQFHGYSPKKFRTAHINNSED
jgi:AraC-like DNA-binding protein